MHQRRLFFKERSVDGIILTMLNKHDVNFLIKKIQSGEHIPLDYKYKLFPTKQKEYELVYAGKMRKEDLLANEDGVFPVPLQVEKVFNGTEHEAFEDDWKNMIVFGDNLQFLKTIYENNDPLIKDKVKGKVKLIYIDPPFASEAEYSGSSGQKAYIDKTKGAEFIEYIRRRLIAARELLSEDGSVYVHLDWKKGHYIKVLLDEIFGEKNFRNEIIWHYNDKFATGGKSLDKNHDTIYHYSKSNGFMGNEIRIAKESKTRRALRKKIDGKTVSILDESGNKIYGEYTDKRVDDVWAIGRTIGKGESSGYPTQKKEALLERIIRYGSDEDDLVMDFFSGSGTTLAVAEKLGRRWIGCDLGKLSYFTMQKRILRIEESKDIDEEKKKYEKKAKSFVTAQLGIYDLRRALDLEWQKYQEFVSSLFEIQNKKNKVAGFDFDGKKSGFPVKFFDYRKFKNSAINEAYLEEMHAVVGKKVSGRVYIVAPANYVDFLSNYYEIGDVKYYFLKIPYHVIKELHKTPFQKMRQPQSKKNVNELEESIGFHFIRHPEVKSELKKDKDSVKILIKSFESQELESDKARNEKGEKSFETLSAVFIDKNYNGKAFEMDEAFFADELLPKRSMKEGRDEEDIKSELKKIEKKGLEITFKRSETGDQVMVIYTDIYGNDFTETFTL